jgi:hypothetical protein
MKTAISVSIVVSLMLLVSAAVWEGVTDVVSTGDLPGNYSVATNSFPKNSIVDITNLENGKMVRAIVVSGLETRGLLATLSRNAANSLDLRGDSTCRVRITQPSDDIAFSRFKLGPIAASSSSVSELDTLAENNMFEHTNKAQNITAVESASDANNAAVMGADDVNTGAGYPFAANAAMVSEEPAVKPVRPILKSTEIITAQTMVEAVTEPAKPVAVEPVRTETAEIIPQSMAAQSSVQTVAQSAVEPKIIPQDAVIQPYVQPVTMAVDNPPESRNAGNLGIIPSEERPPNAANRYAITPENMVPPVKKNNVSNTSSSSPVKSDFSPFQVPLISSLEQGKCYVQVAAYQRAEHVEDEISRIGTSYPLAVQNVGSDANPMFRILLGPLNQGESGALLQRIKSIGYNDAFIRYN